MTPRIETVSMDSLIVRLFDHIDERHMPWLMAAERALRQALQEVLIDLVPSYTTLLVHIDATRLSLAEARRRVAAALEGLAPLEQAEGRHHIIPVWYDHSVGPELGRIAERAGIDCDELIRRHSGRDYCVFALGFAPGYGFMGLVEEALATPRLQTPRQRVPKGSVAIAERQTAVYPMRSPGGWNLIGRTAVELFDRDSDGYSLLRPGDRVRFEAVDRDTFVTAGGDPTPLEERAS
ncbi:5-oxoprolinase subunit PxpB [Kushneria aurantia]|uniref:5-oxoprolinase subunit PxpB n=1 Tax=Kushneria aurantia TaxID=504092 RepID=A0ABV6FYE8_9GAMM|nr:5-oxoprolinase subunit PxpB [Kushneria aurantia]